MNSHIIAIVGRPNVGKSALFNRLLRKRIAIVDEMSGVTRDRIYGQVEWQRQRFTVIDTGGIDLGAEDQIRKQIMGQVTESIGEAGVVLLVVDVLDGITPMDKVVSDLLRRQGKKVIVVVNKVDNKQLLTSVDQFFNLGWQKVIGVSALHGLGIDVLLDDVTEEMPESIQEKAEDKKNTINVAVIGRPNVGKSTVINTLLGKQRMIVDERPGTTRDAVDIKINRNNQDWLFIDTGGIRKNKKLESSVEFYSSRRADISIKRSNVVLLMVDGWEGIRQQDARLMDNITEQGKGCVLVINKWDLITEISRNDYRKRIYRRLGRHNYIPVVFISALKGKNMEGMLDAIGYVFNQARQEVPTGILNRVLNEAVKVNRPAYIRGKPLKVYYATQTGTAPPRFILFVNDPSRMQKVYLAYLTNKIRSAFGFEGVIVKINLRKREKKK